MTDGEKRKGERNNKPFSQNKTGSGTHREHGVLSYSSDRLFLHSGMRGKTKVTLNHRKIEVPHHYTTCYPPL